MDLSKELVDAFVKVTNDSTENKNESTVYGTIVKLHDTTYVRIDGSDLLTPITSTVAVADGERVTVMIKNHNATVTGNVTSPAAKDSDVQGKANKEDLDVEKGRVDELSTRTLTVEEKVTANEGYISQLTVENETIKGRLDAQEADIKVINNEKLSSKDADLKYATIEDANVIHESVRNLEGDYSAFKESSADHFTANDAEIDNLKSQKLNAVDADLKYANIDFSNIGKAAMEYFYAQSGLIKNVTIGDATISGEIVGVTFRGDLIIGNTIVADKLVIKGEDGLYYKLNTDGVVTEKDQTDYNSLNGQIIRAKSVTAEKVAVDDLVAFGATIGGFHITLHSIFSGVKESATNTTRGIFLGDDGQFAFGDGSDYVKYYRDQNGTYKLAISASEITISAGKNLADAMSDLEKKMDDVKYVTGTEVRYQAGASGTTAPTGAWLVAVPVVPTGQYLWTRTTTKYNIGEDVVSYSVGATGGKGEKGEKGDKGDPGATGNVGKDGSSIITLITGYSYDQAGIDQYSASGYSGTWSVESSAGVKVDDTVLLRVMNTSKNGYCYIMAKVTSVPSSMSVTCTSIGLLDKGDKGDQGVKGDLGAAGRGIQSTVVTYQAGASGTEIPTGSWVSSPPATTATMPYMWTKTVYTYTDGTTSESYSVGATPEGIEVGGRNLLRNTNPVNFEYWERNSLSSAIDTEHRFNSERNVFRITYYNSDYSNNTWCGIGQKVNLKPGDTYTVSGYVYIPKDEKNKNCAFQYQGKMYRDAECTDILSYGEIILVDYNDAGEWKYFSYTTSTRVDSKAFMPFFYLYRSGTLYFADLKLEKGNKATDWTPAPEDLDAAIDEVEKKIELVVASGSSSSSLTLTDSAIAAITKQFKVTGNGGNLLSFSDDLTKWCKETGVTVTKQSDGYFYILETDTSKSGRWGIWQNIPVSPNTEYIFSVDGRTNVTYSIVLGTSYGWGSNTVLNQTETKRYVYRFNTGSNTCLRVYLNNQANAGIYLKSPKLEKAYNSTTIIEGGVLKCDDLYSLSAHIGGWDIGPGYIRSRDSSAKFTGLGLRGTTYAFFAGASSSDGSDGAFRVNHDGVLVANNAIINGAITATSLSVKEKVVEYTNVGAHYLIIEQEHSTSYGRIRLGGKYEGSSSYYYGLECYINTGTASDVESSTVTLSGDDIYIGRSSSDAYVLVQPSFGGVTIHGDLEAEYVSLSGSLHFANSTWNFVGDDVYIGDHNKGGCLCIKSAYSSYNPGIVFYDSSDNEKGSIRSDSSGVLVTSDIKAPKILVGSGGVLYASGNDQAYWWGSTLNNLVIESWFGVSFTTNCGGQAYTGKTAIGINCRDGSIRAGGDISTAGGLELQGGWADWKIGSTNYGSIYCNGSNHAFSVRSNSGNQIDLCSDTAMIYCVNRTWSAWATVKGESFTKASSIRYKTNVIDMTEERAKRILQMRPVSYDYTNMGCERDQLGLIAEEVEAIDKYAVSYDEYNRPDSLDYSKFVPQLIKLCQLQQQEINELKETVSKLAA